MNSCSQHSILTQCFSTNVVYRHNKLLFLCSHQGLWEFYILQKHSSKMTQSATFVKLSCTLNDLGHTNPNLAHYMGRMRIGSLCIFLFQHCYKEHFHGDIQNFKAAVVVALIVLLYVTCLCVYVTISCCSNKSLVIRARTDSNSE